MGQKELWTLGFNTIKELETEKGILASGRDEIYGCIFGRDSLITSLKLLKTYEKTGDVYFLTLVKKILINLSHLQGKVTNIESGEEPGKIIHEFRERNHEHLTVRAARPWHVYPDSTMKNYDSVDSTPLFLIAVSRYAKLSDDQVFLSEIMPAVKSALIYVCRSINTDPRGFISYFFHPDRKSGGLLTQSWMDSVESIFFEENSGGKLEDNKETLPEYPIAPVEVQAYTYLALRMWDFHKEADELKQRFNKYFVSENSAADSALAANGKINIAFALDGTGKRMTSLRSSIGHILWASQITQPSELQRDFIRDSILDSTYIPQLVEQILSPELFEPRAGIRTLSKKSRCFDPNSYHNGSIWPHDTAMIAEGLSNFGYIQEAAQVRKALRSSWEFFKTPIELFVFEDNFSEYLGASGQKACVKQAWSAASILSEL